MARGRSPARSWRARLLAAGLASCAVGCPRAPAAPDAGAPSAIACPGRPPPPAGVALEVGTSRGRFVALHAAPAAEGEGDGGGAAAGDGGAGGPPPLDIVAGPQGGIHVVVAFRMVRLDPTLTATYGLDDAVTGAALGARTTRVLRPGLWSTDGAAFVRLDDLVVLDDASADTTPYANREAWLWVEALDAAGRCARDARRVRLRDATAAPPAP